LKPLIEEALLLSWLVADGENRFDASVGEPKAKCQRPIEAKQGRFGREQPVAKGDADECRDVGLALYDMASATEAPSRAVAVLQYGLLACALFGLIGSLVKFATEK
jgi:hypothetical protein